MFIITGLGRCGMSLIGQSLLSMNYKGGKDLNNYILQPIRDLNAALYQQILERGSVDLDAPWKDQTFKEAIKNCTKDQLPVHFLIEPCFMWHNEILKAWLSSRNDLNFLLVRRDIDDILESYKKTPPDKTELFRGSNKAKYESDFEDCLSTIKDLQIPHHVSIYPKFTYDPRTMFKSIKGLSRLQFCYIEASKLMKEILEG